MYSYQVMFMTFKDRLKFEIKSEYKEFVEEFVNDALGMFIESDEGGKPILNTHQKNTHEIRKGLQQLADKYGDKVPVIHGIPAYFRKMEDNESFFLLLGEDMCNMDTLDFHTFLKAEKEGCSFEDMDKEIKGLFGEFRENYQVSVLGESRVAIGERDKHKRICRFCNNTREEVSFELDAHAISEGLGNKTIYLYDECDGCNIHFGKNLEQNIITYLSLFRTIFKVKGKNKGKGKGGKKKFSGRNFNLEHNEKIKLTFNSIEDRPEKYEMPYNLHLDAGEEITLQKIYKSLCKYFLSVIPSEYLPAFTKTIDWINGKSEIDTLPKVAELISYHAFSLQPRIVTYVRKVNDFSIPYAVGEFYFTCRLFVFIIPLTTNDDRDFTDSADFKRYWQTFKHYDKALGWDFKDYSINTPQPFSITLNLQKEDEIFAVTNP